MRGEEAGEGGECLWWVVGGGLGGRGFSEEGVGVGT
jgi:hypothetical protein